MSVVAETLCTHLVPLLPVFGKMLERVLRGRLGQISNLSLFNTQFDFRNGLFGDDAYEHEQAPVSNWNCVLARLVKVNSWKLNSGQAMFLRRMFAQFIRKTLSSEM